MDQLMRKWKTLGLTFALGLAVTNFAAAQGPGYVEITTISVKPSGTADFEDYIKKINAGAAKIGAASPAYFYASRRGGRAYSYVVASPFNKWSDLDSRPSVPEILIKAYGEVEGNRLLKAGRSNIEDVHTSVGRFLTELSSPPPPDRHAAHVRVVRVDVKRGMGSTYEAFTAKVKAAQDKLPTPPQVLRTVDVLGDSDVYTSVYFFDKYAEADGYPGPAEALRKAFGETDAKLIGELAEHSIVHVHTEVFDSRPDLSRLPGAPAAK
jgi:hypothetical protein